MVTPSLPARLQVWTNTASQQTWAVLGCMLKCCPIPSKTQSVGTTSSAPNASPYSPPPIPWQCSLRDTAWSSKQPQGTTATRDSLRTQHWSSATLVAESFGTQHTGHRINFISSKENIEKTLELVFFWLKNGHGICTFSSALAPRLSAESITGTPCFWKAPFPWEQLQTSWWGVWNPCSPRHGMQDREGTRSASMR